MKMTQEQLDSWFGRHVCDAAGQVAMNHIREAALKFASAIVVVCPASAHTTAAIRKVQEAMMTANAAISEQYPLESVKPKAKKRKSKQKPVDVADAPAGNPLRTELIGKMCPGYEECEYADAETDGAADTTGRYRFGLCLDWSGWLQGYWVGDDNSYKYIWLRKKS